MPDNKVVIGIVGEMGAGKGEAAKYLQEKYGGVAFKFSTVMRDVLERLYLPQTRENLQTLSTVLRQTYGDDLFAKTMAQDVASSTSPVIVTEGIRRPSDMAHLSKLPAFHLIAITTDEKIRFDRIHNRNENANDATMTWDEFKIASTAEAETKIREIADGAEFTVNNDGTKDDLHQKLDAIMAQIKNLTA